MAHILVIDDSADLVEILREVLSLEHEVTTAETGREGIATAQRVNPDVVILDMQLPEMNGIEVGLEIKRSVSDVRILVLTALAQSEDEETVLASGCCDAYLPKPATLDAIRDQVAELLERGANAR
ncbi:MAG: response regulator transcription factor [Longimicrobiales bacterium]